ncbi:hypothetical protein M0813_12591 [Anaeramoeba flamelloides]|uniref:Uncharacterized protein n=1 Tax=Anaeramoeba flamelloides TaxID=1746091 RepID=A0ABQ8ZB01_9EUKA|nr:hypothetical protein M0813_12591 [Anaeramoeba flamelloides]
MNLLITDYERQSIKNNLIQKNTYQTDKISKRPTRKTNQFQLGSGSESPRIQPIVEKSVKTISKSTIDERLAVEGLCLLKSNLLINTRKINGLTYQLNNVCRRQNNYNRKRMYETKNEGFYHYKTELTLDLSNSMKKKRYFKKNSYDNKSNFATPSTYPKNLL